eukprot:412941-Alexandrium_andersonii.AAC.1
MGRCKQGTIASAGLGYLAPIGAQSSEGRNCSLPNVVYQPWEIMGYHGLVQVHTLSRRLQPRPTVSH